MDKNNKNFCVVPFVSTMVDTDTTIRYCCMANDNLNKLKKPDSLEFYTCKDNFIQDSWNSQDMRDIRKAMIQGEIVAGCAGCQADEANSIESSREKSITEWENTLGEQELDLRIQQAIDNDGIITEDIVYLDLRLGNWCNLKCRMCHPKYSKEIYVERPELIEKIEVTHNRFNFNKGKESWNRVLMEFSSDVMNDQHLFNDDIMWDQVVSLIPKLKKVYLSGGEPTLIEKNFQFMQSCIDQGRTDILLVFNTNGTNVTETLINLISQFDSVDLIVSIDGIGAVNDYIRSGSDWTQINANVELFAQMPNINLSITPTVQIYNTYNIVNILQWVEELNTRYNRQIFIDFLINKYPRHFDIEILPEHLRRLPLAAMLQYQENKIQLHPAMTATSLANVINLLQQEPAVDSYEQLKAFRLATMSMDVYRTQQLSDVVTPLCELLNHDDLWDSEVGHD